VHEYCCVYRNQLQSFIGPYNNKKYTNRAVNYFLALLLNRMRWVRSEYSCENLIFNPCFQSKEPFEAMLVICLSGQVKPSRGTQQSAATTIASSVTAPLSPLLLSKFNAQCLPFIQMLLTLIGHLLSTPQISFTV
jgi:hypothetical protein